MSHEASCHYSDAHDDLFAKSSEKQKSALMHFNVFLKRCATQTGAEFAEAKNLCYKGLGKNWSQKAIFTWWNNTIGAMFSYFGIDMMIRCDPKQAGMIITWFSYTVLLFNKGAFFTNKFHNETDVPVFGADEWKKLDAKFERKVSYIQLSSR